MGPDTELHGDEEHVMPCAEAMLAGTLALMTGHAQSTCATQRGLVGRKIRSNLFFLSQHPELSPSRPHRASMMDCPGCACGTPRHRWCIERATLGRAA